MSILPSSDNSSDRDDKPESGSSMCSMKMDRCLLVHDSEENCDSILQTQNSILKTVTRQLAQRLAEQKEQMQQLVHHLQETLEDKERENERKDQEIVGLQMKCESLKLDLEETTKENANNKQLLEDEMQKGKDQMIQIQKASKMTVDAMEKIRNLETELKETKQANEEKDILIHELRSKSDAREVIEGETQRLKDKVNQYHREKDSLLEAMGRLGKNFTSKDAADQERMSKMKKDFSKLQGNHSKLQQIVSLQRTVLRQKQNDFKLKRLLKKERSFGEKGKALNEMWTTSEEQTSPSNPTSDESRDTPSTRWL